MALTKVFQKYLSNIFISIVKQGEEWIVYSKVVKDGVLKDKFSKSFDAKEYENIPVKMQEYLDALQLKYNFAYLALFLDSMGQGAFRGITAVDFEKNSVDIKSVTHFDIEKKWSIYASFMDIDFAKKLFVKVGIDFIYSPFMVQYSLIKKLKTRNGPILYMLNHQDSVTITVFDDKELLFGAYFKTTTDNNLSSGEDEDLEELSKLDDLYIDDNNLELFGRDALIYKYLKSSLKEFYTNLLYSSSFIDKIIICDGYEISAELIDTIESELFMDIEINKINISEIVCNMAKEEVFG